MPLLSRRSFCFATASALALRPAFAAEAPRVPGNLDHIILGCPDLEQGIEYVYRHLGVRAAPGGIHPGAGTKNALLSLGTLRYLEIIAPDPDQPASADPRDVIDLKHPALVGWAIHRHDVDQFAQTLRAKDVPSMGPKPGSRKRPNGTTLTWKSLVLEDDHDGVLPFFIEWGLDSPHPSTDSPPGCRLIQLQLSTPEPAAVKQLAEKLELGVQIVPGSELQLHATLVGPKGRLSLQSR
jgi:hypothetical protein